MKIECGSKLMEGFADGSCELARRPDQDYPDLSLYDTIQFEGCDGQIAYEGRGDGFPGDVSEDLQRVGVRTVGWMTHARDQPMPPLIYVDRVMSKYVPVGTNRRNQVVDLNYTMYDPVLRQDSVDALGAALGLDMVNHQDGSTPIAEALYDAGAKGKIGSFYYNLEWGANVTGAGFAAYIAVGATDDYGGYESTADLVTANGRTSVSATYDLAVPGRFCIIGIRGSGTVGFTGNSPYDSDWRIVMFGDQGLTKQGTAPLQGYLASDMLVDSGRRYAPLLDYSQVLASAFVIQQAALDQQTDPYDFWLDLNKWEMRHLAVWEDKKLYFDPFDNDTVDWRVRTDEQGVRVRHAGPSAGRICNGVIVSYQNVSTLRSEIITPDDNPLLADTDPTLPANVAGVKAWQKIQMPDPDSAAGAVRYGQLALARLNKQRAPTRVTVKGHIRDDARHWHQGWVPRANQTVLLENEENAVPRMIHEARWNADAQTVTLSLDAESETIDAILDKLLTETKMARSR